MTHWVALLCQDHPDDVCVRAAFLGDEGKVIVIDFCDEHYHDTVDGKIYNLQMAARLLEVIRL